MLWAERVESDSCTVKRRSSATQLINYFLECKESYCKWRYAWGRFPLAVELTHEFYNYCGRGGKFGPHPVESRKQTQVRNPLNARMVKGKGQPSPNQGPRSPHHAPTPYEGVKGMGVEAEGS